jgi:hypothetical protein
MLSAIHEENPPIGEPIKAKAEAELPFYSTRKINGFVKPTAACQFIFLDT